MENMENFEKETRIQKALSFLRDNTHIDNRILEKVTILLFYSDSFLERIENAEKVYLKNDEENKRHGIMLLENIVSDVKAMLE